MTDEKLKKAQELKNKICNIENILGSEELRICNDYYYDNCHFKTYFDDDLNKQLREILSKKLVQFKKEYEAL